MSYSSVIALDSKQERGLILLAALVQFVNVLDFMMVMPLGPDFAKALGISASHIGIIGGAYTFAAALAGLLFAPFVDEFPRKKALLVTLGGLVIATFAGAFVWDLHSMIAARVLAGIFGGQMFALSQAIIADYVPPERRGTAMGKVAGGFAAASVIGVPFGLELATRYGWQAPFISTGIMGVIIWCMAYYKLPYHRSYAQGQPLRVRIKRLTGVFNSRLSIASYLAMGFCMLSGFSIIPNISAHLQMNLHYPREHLGLLYLFGGLVSFFGMRFSGRMMDKYSATLVSIIFTTILSAAIAMGFVFYPFPLPIIVIFVMFMVGMSGRNVCVSALSSKVPAPSERGAYMSLQATVTHLCSALGAYSSSLILEEQNGHIIHIGRVGIAAIGVAMIVPFLVRYVERCLVKRGQTSSLEPVVLESL